MPLPAKKPETEYCPRCEAPLYPGKMRCPSCKLWVIQPLATKEPENTAGPLAGTVILNDVESEDADRLSTGFWDVCWGCNDPEPGHEPVYGIVRGSTTLIGGSPGAGKSTLGLQLVGSIARLHSLHAIEPGCEPLIIASEEQLKQIKERAKRLKMHDVLKHIRMLPAMSGTVDLDMVLRHFKPPLMLLDSLKGMTQDDDAMAIEVCNIFKSYATSYNCPGIIITHATKADVIAGKLAVQHTVDTTMTFFPDEELFTVDAQGAEEPVRVIEVKKNRNGARTMLKMAMTATGLVPYVEPEDDDEENDE